MLRTSSWSVLLCAAVVGCALPEGADERVSSESASRSALFVANATLLDDATIYEDNPTANGGAYPEFCVGNQALTTGTRRAFVRYTLPAIPQGSTITRVQLSFTQDNVR